MSLEKSFLKTKPVCKVTFSLPVNATDGAEKVELLGEFNDWDKAKAVPMKLEDGVFKTTLKLPVGKNYEFRYLIDGEFWENDWKADQYQPNPFGEDNSVVIAIDLTQQN